MFYSPATLHQYVSSTELLVETGEAWSLAGELPYTISVMGCASLDNRIFLAGFIDIFINHFKYLKTKNSQSFTSLER